MSLALSRAAFAALLALVPVLSIAPPADAVAATGIPAPPVFVSAGSSHTCAVTAATGVACWGDNGVGQLGDGTTTSSVAPVAVVGLTGVVEVAAGGQHTCARTVSGTVSCWGANYAGQLGDGTGTDTTAPTAVSGLTDVSAISAGATHTCALLADGTVWCWGDNSDGAVGDGTTDDALEPTQVGGVAGVVDVSAGDEFTCAVTASGTASCWGFNGDGQLGNGTTTDETVPAPVTGLTDATSIDAGFEHTCAVRAAGTVACWGDNDYGDLGDGTLTSALEPVGVVTLTSVSAVEAGDDFSCALLTTGSARCWGDRQLGALGDGTDSDISTIPTTVIGVTDGVAISVGRGHACAALADASVRCWGDSFLGAVGSGLPYEIRSAVQVPGVSDASHVLAADDATCAVLLDGTVTCWGANWAGQLGRGTDSLGGAPAPVPGLADVVDGAGGGDHVCVWRTTGTAACWGQNNRGQLGDGTEERRPSPVEVSGLTTADRMAAGDEHTCAILTSSEVQCWGHGFYGALGTGSTTDQPTPTTVPGLTASVIAAGGSTSCARDLTGIVRCWGRNDDGEVGDGTTTQRNSPVAIASAFTFARVDVGDDHACASRPAGPVCWGDNINGQLGDGTSTDRLSPVAVSGGTGGGRIAAGDRTSCLLVSGAVQCWGANYSGQLGNDSVVSSSNIPVPVVDITDATDLAVGGDHACVVRTDSTVWCWGYNALGQVGDLPYRVTATQVVGVTVAVPAPAPGTSPLVPLTPARLLDTRAGQPTIDGAFSGPGARPAGSVLELQVSGRGGVPADAVAAVINVTAVGATAPGYATIYPCDAARPVASSLNYLPGDAIPNEVIARLSSTGTACLFTLSDVDLVADVTGWSPPGSTYQALVPARVLDTRANEPTVDGRFAGLGRRPAGSTLELPVTGRGGVPSDPAAVVVNVAAIGAAAPGYVTVYPCDLARPLASSLNVAPGAVTPNEIVAKVSATGTICIYTLTEVDLIADVTGAIPVGAGYDPLPPARFLDTRPGETTVDGQQAGAGHLAAGDTLTLPIVGRNGFGPASAATVNVTAIGVGAPGYVTVYPCDQPRPVASSLNVLPGQPRPNEIIAKLSPVGTICLYALSDVDLIVDVTGALR